MDSSQALIAAYEAIFQNNFPQAHQELESYNSCSESLLLRATLFFQEADLSNAFSFAVRSLYSNPLNKRAWALARDTLCYLSPPLSEVTVALITDLLSQDGLDHQKLSPYVSKVLAPLANASLQDLEQYPLYLDVLSKMLLLGWNWEQARDRLRRSLLDPNTLDLISLPHLAGLSYQFYLSDYLPESEDYESFLQQEHLKEPKTLKDLFLKSCFCPLTEKDFKKVSEKTSPYFLELHKRYKTKKITSEKKTLFSDATLHQFYESNPYPRWETLDLLESPFSKHVELSLDLGKPIQPLTRCLIAGAGTGAHLLELAARYPKTQFVGIDLSQTSLQFAEAKAALYTDAIPALFNNIEFIQADLCNFTSKTPFDWIECVGVIHHLESPQMGWKALHQLASPHALLLGGVYHRHARELIQYFKNEDLPLQALREKIAQDPFGLPLMHSQDFYSLHACRDLLFHPREKSYTLTEIIQELSETGWKFLKIEFQTSWKSLYRKEHPEDYRCEKIESLLSFEKAYPNAFNGMILFWAEKV